ncbi:748_t:CDS:2 [Dentiscutata heterogama]|uniref:748_t:CDS:1 n=1 Tax=Dentiscutata heterogama TaxID=1316150 RepID=A0ACA9M0K7_9GLOM|nr:748_t:CDS:2 [Dentiscutata heterogama]
MGGSSRHERDRDYSEGSSSRRSRQDDSVNVSSGTANEVGREFANRYGGLFSEKDWKCPICSNINWARRAECNQCKTPKPGLETTMGSREGRGGGFMERDEVVEYKKSRDAEKDEEWDEFGRKRKKNRDSGIYNNGNDGRREFWAAWDDIIGNEDTKEKTNGKKDNQNRSIDDREQSKKPRLDNQYRRRSSRSRSPCRRDRSLSRYRRSRRSSRSISRDRMRSRSKSRDRKKSEIDSRYYKSRERDLDKERDRRKTHRSR